MWRHPITTKQIRVLAQDWGIKDNGAIQSSSAELAGDSSQPGLQEGWFQVIEVSVAGYILGSILGSNR